MLLSKLSPFPGQIQRAAHPLFIFQRAIGIILWHGRPAHAFALKTMGEPAHATVNQMSLLAETQLAPFAEVISARFLLLSPLRLDVSRLPVKLSTSCIHPLSSSPPSATPRDKLTFFAPRPAAQVLAGPVLPRICPRATTGFCRAAPSVHCRNNVPKNALRAG